MKSRSDVENLEKVTRQLTSMHSEVTSLAKKSPNDAINLFKLNLINKVLQLGNEILGNKYVPFPDFETFNSDDLPSNSDVAMVLGQYLEEAERYRSDNLVFDRGSWFYIVNKKKSDMKATPPSRIGKK